MTKPLLERTEIIGLLGLITALTAVATDIVIPAIGVIAQDLGASDARAGLLVGAYMLAFAVGQLFCGLASDAYGRRPVLLVCFGGFTLVSLACAVAQSFEALVFFRFLQGLFGAGSALARAIVRDVSSGTSAARSIGLMSTILTIATIIAPLLGSAFVAFLGWRAIFVALAMMTAGFYIATLRMLPETGTRRPERLSFSYVGYASKFLFSKRDFVIPVLTGAFIFAAYIALISNAPVAMAAVFGVVPEAVGGLLAIIASVNVCGVLLARRLLNTRSPRAIIRGATGLACIAALGTSAMIAYPPSLPVFWAGMCLYALAFGLIFPTSQAAALEPAGEMPGFAASIMGSIQMSFGFLGSVFVSGIFDGSLGAIFVSLWVFSALAALTLLTAIFARSSP
ncbi:MAG: MFS transporter [Pseudomonadota bacterium]